ncbi:MAG: hypothetical protein ACOCP8_02695 [archaeon]
MTIVELIKANFLFESVSGGISISVSYGFLWIVTLLIITFLKIKKMIKNSKDKN